MVHQFEAEKCFQCGINCRLGTLTLCNRFDPGGPPGNSDGTNPGTRAESWEKSPGVARGVLVFGTD